MEICTEGLGKRFRSDWIFQDLDFRSQSPDTVALLGANGAGKSTLMKILAGLATPSVGRVRLSQGERVVEAVDHAAYCSFTAPYLELPEELSLSQLLDFHFSFRPLLAGVARRDIPELLRLSAASGRSIQEYSSGMKQRVKLGIALLTDVPFLFLDEPLTNLDADGVEWYHELVAAYRKDRFLMVASNRVDEYGFCTRTLQMADYKKQRLKPIQ